MTGDLIPSMIAGVGFFSLPHMTEYLCMGEEDGKLDIEGECVKKLNTLKYVGSVITNV
jgi:hypothetical protein